MKIYFVRHGKTNASAGDAISHNDSLNKVGQVQAAEVATQLKDTRFDAIISSPSRRALQTAEAINEFHGLSIVQDKRLRERDLKKYTSLEEWNESFDFNNIALLEDVEPLKDFFLRVYEAINDLERNYNSKTVLIVAHGGVHHALYAYVNKLPLAGNMRISRVSYCELKVYEI